MERSVASATFVWQVSLPIQRLLFLVDILKVLSSGAERDGSEVKRLADLVERTQFHSQHPCCGSQALVTPVTGDSMFNSDFLEHVVGTHTCT